MILKRMSIWERFLLKISKKRRIEYEKRMREGLRYLMDHPEIDVQVLP